MPRLLKESEAWREIARRLAENDLSTWGHFLCNQATRLYREGALRPLAFTEMRGRVEGHLLPHTIAWSDDGAKNDDGSREVRVLAALFLSYEAADEGK